MGWKITGYIECWEPAAQEACRSWTSICELHPLYQGRNYDSFGCLFGWQNFAHFRPIAAKRGLPPDVSSEVRAMHERYGRRAAGTTWINWADIQAIDWEEEAEQADSRIHRYERNEHGELVYKGKAAWDREFAEIIHGPQLETEAGVLLNMMEGLFLKTAQMAGQQWEKGDIVFRAEKLKRKEACDDWQSVFQEMQKLAETCGNDGVRLVIWFSF